MKILIWASQNAELLITIFGLFCALLTALAHLTPTKRDDEIVEKIKKFGDTLIKVLSKKPITTEAHFDALSKDGLPKKPESQAEKNPVE